MCPLLPTCKSAPAAPVIWLLNPGVSSLLVYRCAYTHATILVLFTARTDRGYEPAGRYVHSSAVVGERLFVWAGYQDDAPMAVHDSAEKRAFLSRIEVFHLQSGTWEQQLTRERPPLGAIGYACAAVEDDLYFFGGWCGHGECKHNSLYNLSTATFRWKMLTPTTSRGTGPMRKSHCQMVPFKDGGVDILFVVGGSGEEPIFRQSGASYERDIFGTATNEQHLFFVNASEYSSSVYA